MSSFSSAGEILFFSWVYSSNESNPFKKSLVGSFPFRKLLDTQTLIPLGKRRVVRVFEIKGRCVSSAVFVQTSVGSTDFALDLNFFIFHLFFVQIKKQCYYHYYKSSSSNGHGCIWLLTDDNYKVPLPTMGM